MLKKKKGGGEKVRKKCINERETVSYEQQILDYNRQLSRFVYEKIDNDTLRNFVLFLVQGLISCATLFKDYAVEMKNWKTR